MLIQETQGVALGYLIMPRWGKCTRGEAPWRCCAWPLANRTSRDVLAPNARPGFFANGDIHRNLGQRPRNRD